MELTRRIGVYFIVSPQITLTLLLSDAFVEVKERQRPVFFQIVLSRNVLFDERVLGLAMENRNVKVNLEIVPRFSLINH